MCPRWGARQWPSTGTAVLGNTANSILDRPAAIRALGRHIEGLGGVYQTGPDAGFTREDQQALMQETQSVAHFDVDGGMQSAGDATAEGAMHGILRALQMRSELQVDEITEGAACTTLLAEARRSWHVIG